MSSPISVYFLWGHLLPQVPVILPPISTKFHNIFPQTFILYISSKSPTKISRATTFHKISSVLKNLYERATVNVQIRNASILLDVEFWSDRSCSCPKSVDPGSRSESLRLRSYCQNKDFRLQRLCTFLSVSQLHRDNHRRSPLAFRASTHNYPLILAHTRRSHTVYHIIFLAGSE